jgi:phosphatidate cytidylyltransferase
MMKRIIIAVLILPFLGWIILLDNPQPFLFVGAAGLLAALYELYGMMKKKGVNVYDITGMLASAAVYYCLIMDYGVEYYFYISGIFIIALLIGVILSKKAENLEGAFFTLGGALYITTLGAFALSLRQLDHGKWWIFLLLLMTWVYDGGAYFIGSFFGRHKLIPELSPGKTIEGCAGGLVINIIVSVIIYYTVIPDGTPIWLPDIIILSVLLSVFGQLGDIAASAMKRFTAVKNSSGFFGEHGGFLDKIDSSIFNAPILYFYLVFILKII